MPEEKKKYRIWCEQVDVPLFMQAWWMDAVCVKGSWEVFLYEENNEIVAAMPFHIRKKFGLRFIIQPQMTQYSGIWIHYPENIASYKRYELEKRVCNYFIDRLKSFGYFYYKQNFPPQFTNWLPFYWRGFRQTTRYSFVLDDLSDTESLILHFNDGKKQHIKKAERWLTTDCSLTAETFYDLHLHCLKAQGQKITYSRNLLTRLYDAALARNQGMIVAVRDHQEVHAALLIVWDANNAYNLISAIDPRHRASGGSSLIFREAIRTMSKRTHCFDFEGSMIKGVADSFAQFGAKMTPYLSIQRYRIF
jgi:hypothetical protein